ncbi:hypothetical protein KGF54_005390 [Candida jiufengensis]|uniref:uncharacterized protein n=1 Tax=Candida jiufengensis TaxID=497108 RepID=UPI0022242FBD|nr:uncharacterized protein KGF54_005390 [Candida jiufengensis]KAI5949912.1 hypothetical protein KGF54_005390 [Candida jiufengensis]
MSNVLILHIGAGNHSLSSNKKYAQLIKKALKQKSILEVSDILEKSPLTNTGYGSNLNLLGEVEIDASFMKSDGSVGSLTGLQIDCPTREMFRIFEKINELYSKSSIGKELLKPVTLNVSRLKKFINVNESFNVITKENQKIFDSHKTSINEFKSFNVQDTIGIISLKENETVITSSSGGNFFKLPGRIGCAGIIGASIGFKSLPTYELEISCICSGNGEQILKYNLASQLVNSIIDMDESNYVEELRNFIFKLDPQFYCGFIIVINYSGSKIRLLYGHTTESFHFGYKVNSKSRAILSFNESPGKFTFGEYELRFD